MSDRILTTDRRVIQRPPRRQQRGFFIIDPYREAGGGDPFFSSVVQMAHFDGSNGSTTLTNSCARGNTLTVLGSATISTAQSKWGGASLRSPNASSGAQNLANIADYGFGTGAHTLEGWFRFDTLRDYNVCFAWNDGSPLVNCRSSGQVSLYADSGYRIVSANGVCSANTWHFISFCQVGAPVGSTLRNWYLHVDGNYIGSWNFSALTTGTGQLYCGQDAFGAALVGYADDFRVTKGVCRYGAANYAVPTGPFPNS
jgi:hypothetical protein